MTLQLKRDICITRSREIDGVNVWHVTISRCKSQFLFLWHAHCRYLSGNQQSWASHPRQQQWAQHLMTHLLWNLVVLSGRMMFTTQRRTARLLDRKMWAHYPPLVQTVRSSCCFVLYRLWRFSVRVNYEALIRQIKGSHLLSLKVKLNETADLQKVCVQVFNY